MIRPTLVSNRSAAGAEQPAGQIAICDHCKHKQGGGPPIYRFGRPAMCSCTGAAMDKLAKDLIHPVRDGLALISGAGVVARQVRGWDVVVSNAGRTGLRRGAGLPAADLSKIGRLLP